MEALEAPAVLTREEEVVVALEDSVPARAEAEWLRGDVEVSATLRGEVAVTPALLVLETELVTPAVLMREEVVVAAAAGEAAADDWAEVDGVLAKMLSTETRRGVDGGREGKSSLEAGLFPALDSRDASVLALTPSRTFVKGAGLSRMTGREGGLRPSGGETGAAGSSPFERVDVELEVLEGSGEMPGCVFCSDVREASTISSSSCVNLSELERDGGFSPEDCPSETGADDEGEIDADDCMLGEGVLRPYASVCRISVKTCARSGYESPTTTFHTRGGKTTQT